MTAVISTVPNLRQVSLTDHAIAITVKTLAYLAAILPPTLFIPLGRLAGRISYAVGIRRHIVEKNVTKAFPELSDKRKKAIVVETYQNTCISIFWFLHLRAFNRWRDIHKYVDIDLPQEYIDDVHRGPVLVTTGHIGCWELLPFIHTPGRLNVKDVVEIYRPLHNRPLDRYVYYLRQHSDHIKLVPDKHCLPLLTDILMSPVTAIVALICDQRPSRGALPISFFRQVTQVAPGLAVLHQRSHKPIWFSALTLEPTDSSKPFRLHTFPISRAGNLSASEIMQVYATRLEVLVQMFPSQYFWFHDLWKDTDNKRTF